ncbi:MAG TPA: Uma2 family endonuclease [Gemmataceae bacterium]|nr:Uma2 family endonuclease [Gemmataceae bacterium]
MATATTAQRLLTAEEYGRLPDDGRRTELVRGEVVEVNMPYPRHGQICFKIARILGNFVEERQLGHVLTNDSGVITERDADTVRGADVAYYSFARVPPGPMPRGQYLSVVPELVFEVRSPGDRWRAVLDKVNEYLKAGVDTVCVVDDPTERAIVFDDDDIHPLTRDEALEFPKLLPGFSVAVRPLFE